MQSTTLLDNLNSDLYRGYSGLSPKKDPQQVLVYVEGHKDIAFWKSILTPFEQKKLYFDVQLPSQDTLEQGKETVLKLANATGKHLILCVDSDYDYLRQKPAATATQVNINTHEFIFQTYAYAIENLQCYAPSLHNVCVNASKNNTQVIDFEALMKLYSEYIYKLFLWSVHFDFKGDTTSFPLDNFSKTIKILGKPDVSEQFATVLQALKYRVDAKIEELEQQFPDDISHVESLIQTLKPLGVKADNVYLFAQCHTIQDNVVLMFLNSVWLYLRSESEKRIKTQAKHRTELANQINQYKNQLILIETALNLNTNFKSCFLYQKIHADLERYVQNFEQNPPPQ